MEYETGARCRCGEGPPVRDVVLEMEPGPVLLESVLNLMQLVDDGVISLRIGWNHVGAPSAPMLVLREGPGEGGRQGSGTVMVFEAGGSRPTLPGAHCRVRPPELAWLVRIWAGLEDGDTSELDLVPQAAVHESASGYEKLLESTQDEATL